MKIVTNFFFSVIIIFTLNNAIVAQQATNLDAFHSSGQTFLTWNEATGSTDGDTYRIYRFTSAINAGNLSSATMVAEVSHNSGYYTREASRTNLPHPSFAQQRYIIQDMGTPLAAGVGLFVNTIHSSGNYYYAVTYVNAGSENSSTFTTNTLSSPVSELIADPKPIRVWQSPDGWGRIYTQFMDYSNWNPAFEGYAYNYAISVPPDYTGGQLPLSVYMHGWDLMNTGYAFQDTTCTPWGWETIIVYIDDIYCTWNTGFSETATPMGPPGWDIPTTGPIRNFSEEKIMRTVYDIIHDPYYNVDTNRIYAFGHSMGGTGALGLGMHYGNVFAAVYCSEPMTNWAVSGSAGGQDWVSDVEPKWGTTASNLPIENQGHWSNLITPYNGWGIWNWTNRHAMLDSLAGMEMAYIALYHGTLDDVIDFETEAQPFYQHFYSGKRAFAGNIFITDHTWNGFFDPPDWVFGNFEFRKNEAIPAFSNASNSTPMPPAGAASFNTDLEWSASWHDFDGPPIDYNSMFRITLRSLTTNQTADVTIRRFQGFHINANDTIHWWNVSMLTGDTLTSGTVFADKYGLATVPGFSITTDGNRLILAHSSTVSGIAENSQSAEKYELLISPNPFKSCCKISFSEFPEAGKLEAVDILDSKGISIMKTSFDFGNNNSMVWCPDDKIIKEGLYFIKATFSDQVVVKKVLYVK
jgi:hypothetical protein